MAAGHSQGWAARHTRLHVNDVVMTDGGTWTLPSPRLLVERFTGSFWTWLDREEFLVPKNVLDIVAGQTVTWMGLFYCPLLPLLNSVFIFLTFYIKKVRPPGLGGGRGCRWGGLGPTIPSCFCPPPQRHLPGPQAPRHLGTGSRPPCATTCPQYTLMRNSKASPRRFRASSSTFFFQLVLILGLLLAVMPLGYVVSR